MELVASIRVTLALRQVEYLSSYDVNKFLAAIEHADFQQAMSPADAITAALFGCHKVMTKSMLRQSITVSIVGWSSVSCLDVMVHDKERMS